MSLMIQMIIKNNEATLKECLNSLSKLNCNIKIIDIGSNDNSISICEDFGIKPLKKSLNNNYSKLRNDNMQDAEDWFMWLQPWEKIVSGWNEINLITSQKDYLQCFDFKVVNRKNITRELKLWNNKKNIKFKNYLFETPDFDQSIAAENVIIQQMSNKINFQESLEILNYWEFSQPLIPEINYYKAYLMLLCGQYDQFCNQAKHYLFNSKKGSSDLMLRYGLATIQIYNKNLINEGIKNVLNCILHKPTMAEFWCLLGDAYYRLNVFNKAISFYENALIIGSRRESDLLPVDISKYKEYPLKMIENCTGIIKGTKLFSTMSK